MSDLIFRRVKPTASSWEQGPQLHKSLCACVVCRCVMMAISCLAMTCRSGAAEQSTPISVSVPPDQAELLRATFDNGFDADFARGSRALVPVAYDRGIAKDVKAYRAAQGEGVRGKGLRIGPGQSHRFLAWGNVNVRRGTIAFWVKLSQDLGNVHLPILYVTTVERSGSVLLVRGRHRRILCHVPGASFDFQGRPWKADTWYHLAVTWDELKGIRLFKDGQRTRQQDVTWHAEDCEPDNLILGSSSAWGGGPVSLQFDELRVFSRPLTDEEVRGVFEGRDDLPPQPVEEGEATDRHRRAYLGWDDAPDMATLEPGNGEDTLLVKRCGIDQARAVKSQAWKVCDGDRQTRWPLTYHGYSFQHEAGLALKLFAGQAWNYLRVLGPCAGNLYQGQHILRPETEPAIRLTSEGPLCVRRLAEPSEASELTFFADAEDQGSGEQRTLVREMGFYSVDRQSAVSPAGSAGSREAYYLPGQPRTDRADEIGLLMQSKYEPADRTSLGLSPTVAPTAGALLMKALRYYHFMLSGGRADRAFSGLRVVLFFRNLQAGTVLWVRVADPLTPTRYIADFEVRAGGNWSGIQRADLTLDVRDHALPRDCPLWISVMTGNDAQLAWDGDEHRSRIELLTKPVEALEDEYLHDQLAFVKDRFIDVSEPRPWGKVEMSELAKRVGVFMELHRALDDLHHRFPHHSGVNAFYLWTHPRDRVDRSHLRHPQVAGAPEWAVYQCAALRRYLDFAHWWIDERQVPNGEFGHRYGDDTDLINDWLTLAQISDPGGRLADSVRRIADFCWDTGPIQSGINARETDPLHAYEEGLNAACRLAEIDYGNPVYVERMMLATRTVRDHLTALSNGRRHFRSRLYGAKRVVTEKPYDRDSLTSTLMLHPALFLGYYSRNPLATRLVSEYGDAWLELFEQAVAENGPLSTRDRVRFPSMIQFEDRSVTSSDKFPSGYGHASMFLALREWTGDDRYFLAQRAWLERGSADLRTLADWIDYCDLTRHRERLVKEAEAVDYVPLDPAMGNDRRTQCQYVGWRLSGHRDLVVEALRDSWERIELLFPMHTWAEQSADRVAISKDLVDRLYLGGTPGYRNNIYPTHSVSWEGFSPSFAAWVLETTPKKLTILAYNFEEQPQSGRLRVWRLEPGRYAIKLGPDADENGVPDRVLAEAQQVLCKGAALDLQLPSRQTVALRLEQTAADDGDYYARCDLAVAAQDCKVSNGEATIRVHNLGSGRAPAFVVALRAGDRTIATQQVGPLEAPLDCLPKIAELKFAVTTRPGALLSAVVDPEDAIAELHEGNNSATLTAE